MNTINKLLFPIIANKLKFLVKLLIKFIGILLSKLLCFILFLKKLAVVTIREDRIGHQIGTLDCELFIASERKKKYEINTIFLFIEPLDNVANKYFRKITGSIVNSFNFNYYIFKTNSKYNLIIKLIKEYLPNNQRFYYSSKTLTSKTFVIC